MLTGKVISVVLVLFSVTITDTRNVLQKRYNCKPLWHSKCSKNSECCTKNCEKQKTSWQYGFCGPSKAELGASNKCKPLWFQYCKQHGDCCSINCVKEKKEWTYGYCAEKSPKLVTEVKQITEPTPSDEENEIEPRRDTCGMRNANARLVGGRIVGGSPAVRNEFPWQVGIEFNEMIRGGGSIITDRWIMTAAHLFNGDIELEKYRGIIGTVSIDEASIYVFFDELILHPEFNHTLGDYNNDIALLHTTKAMTLYPKWDVLNRVCLPQPNAEFQGTVTASGWGNIDDEGTPAERLMAVDLHIQNDDVCEKEYPQAYKKTTMICAGKPHGGKDSCLGDSGGPLVRFEKGTATVTGIVSYGPRDRTCGKKGSVAVYTKVSKYIDWIKRSIHEK